MKKFTKLLAAFLAAGMLLGLAVSADDSAVAAEVETEVEVEVESELELPAFIPAVVMLNVETPDANISISGDLFALDGELTAADVVVDLLNTYEPELEYEILEDGSVASLGGIENGAFGGEDAWRYMVNYYVPMADGQIEHFIDLPTSAMGEYQLGTSCQIVLYYGDAGLNCAGFTFAEDGSVKLVEYKPVYDENGVLVSFEELPLAGGSFVFREILTAEDGTQTLGEAVAFVADENGVTELDAELRALANATYVGSVEKQNGDKPEVIRASDIYIVNNLPTAEELFKEKVDLLIIAAMM